ncbi:thiamine phosphate synthase [Glaciimonas immobilis]|uniref:Thiamine-phosphate synthase n=1 Tax=Glaciimonas immobilis TaxID=728004 RepID=A0A840RX36_9BURK|nr:thiamine phosphate synthase [Glaciimonas immobilis]KAF3997363.1 thiamine phosphate synthase [Glaciimonas immobilis]MBB5200979.1 thiamine-phosphate pyrophosphorylase [Glaciimonas immobilis]
MKSLKGLYIVTPDWYDTAKLLEVSEQALQGGAAILQYRHKTAGTALRAVQATLLFALCRRYQRPFIINDDVDLCLALDADGIHVGGTDASVADIRAQVGPNKIVGTSCYGSVELAHAAVSSGASYVAFGGFYPSRVKQYEVSTQAAIVTEAKSVIALPNVVIGGMTVQNATPLVAAGADMVAAISSVYLANDPVAAARQFADLFAI